MNRHLRRNIVRYVLISLSVLTGGAILASYLVSRHYQRIIKRSLPGWVASATDGLYQISVSGVTVNILNRSLTVRNISLTVDTARFRELQAAGQISGTVYQIAIPRVRAEGVLWENLVLNKEIECKKLTVLRPQVKIMSLYETKQPLKKAPQRPSALSRLAIEDLLVEDGSFFYRQYRERDTLYCSAVHSSASLKNWELKPGVADTDTSRFLKSADATIRLGSCITFQPGQLFVAQLDSVIFLNTASLLRVRNFNLYPVTTLDPFASQQEKVRESYRIIFPVAELRQLRWQALLRGEACTAHELWLDSASLNVFKERLVVADTENKLGRFPPQILLKIKFPLYIQTARFQHSHAQYSEYNYRTRRTGILRFDNMTGSGSNITNQPERIARNPDLILKFNGLFQEHSNLMASFTFPLTDTKGRFGLEATLRNLEAYQLTETAKALALAEINDLHLDWLKISLQGDERQAGGDFSMQYQNLKLGLQKIDTVTYSLNDRPLLSMLANELILFPANPMPGDTLRKVAVFQQRDTTRSFFNLIWKNIFQGIGYTILRDRATIEYLSMRRNQIMERKAGKEARREQRHLRRQERQKRRAAREAAR